MPSLKETASKLGRIETDSLVVFLLAERAPSEGPRPSAQLKIDQAAVEEAEQASLEGSSKVRARWNNPDHP